MRKSKKVNRLEAEKQALEQKYEQLEGVAIKEEIARLMSQMNKAEDDRRTHANSYKLLIKDLKRNVNYLVAMMNDEEANTKKAK